MIVATSSSPSWEGDEYVPISLHWPEYDIPGMLDSIEYVTATISDHVEFGYLEFKTGPGGVLLELIVPAIWHYDVSDGSVVTDDAIPGNPRISATSICRKPGEAINRASINLQGRVILFADGVGFEFMGGESTHTLDAGGVQFSFNSLAVLTRIGIPLNSDQISTLRVAIEG